MKRLVCVLLFVLTAALCCVSVSAADPVVTDMDVQCVVDKNGNCEITATLDVFFEDPSGKVRIPIGENVKNVRAPGYRATRESEGDTTWLVLRGSDGTVGSRTIVLTYRKQHNVSYTDDGSQLLKIELRSPFWDWKAENFTFSIVLPAPFEAIPVYKSGYYGEDIVVSDTVSEQGLEGTVVNGLLDLESVSVEMILPKGYFRVRNMQGGTAEFVMIVMIVLASIAALYWFFFLRNPILRVSERKSAPDGIAAWEFPYVSGDGQQDPILLLIEWANLGYITIHVDQHGRVTLKKRIPMSNERKVYECNAFEALFFRGNTCAGDTPQCRKLGRLAAKGSCVYWNKRLFSPNSGNTLVPEMLSAAAFALLWFRAMDFILPPWALRMVLMLPALILGYPAARKLQKAIHDLLQKAPDPKLMPALGILAVTVLLTILSNSWGITLLILLMQYLAELACGRGGKRTEDGMDRISQIRGFRRYLSRMSTHQLQLLLNQNNQYFYEMLPYAEALGMGKQFAKKFAQIRLEPCAWLNDGRNPSQTALNFYADFKKLLRRMRGRPGK